MKQVKSVLKNSLLPEWKEADEIVRHVWLGTPSENQQARSRHITNVICVSEEPQADLEREGFRKAPDIDTTVFPLDSDDEGDLLPIFSEVCDVIDRTLGEGEGVLVCDVGGGVAVLAAYLMRTHKVSLPEAMTDITRARLKRPHRTLLPSERIIDLLHNETYQEQLDMWEVLEYDIFENVIVNPDAPREKWIVEKVGEEDEDEEGEEGSSSTGKKKKKEKADDKPPLLKRIVKKLPQIFDQPHRLSTIAEVEEEARRLSTIVEAQGEEEEGSKGKGKRTWFYVGDLPIGP